MTRPVPVIDIDDDDQWALDEAMGDAATVFGRVLPGVRTYDASCALVALFRALSVVPAEDVTRALRTLTEDRA